MKLLFTLARKFLLSPSKFMNQNPVYHKYQVGDFTYGFPRVYDSETGPKLIVGKYCCFADEVMILLSDEHNTQTFSTYPFNVFWGSSRPTGKGDIVIGHDVWVGNRATILSNVSIGTGAIIGAGAVVAKDVPAYAVAVGNPAKVVKYRFDQETIEALLKSKWWLMPHNQLKQLYGETSGLSIMLKQFYNQKSPKTTLQEEKICC